jgi:D-3-phosphoglycerate dehydrogenase
VEADRLARLPWGEQSWLGQMEPLETLTLGLVGLGRIGRAVAERMRPLVGAMQAYDPASPPLPEGMTACGSLEELLATSDLVSLHLPLLPETARLLGAAQFAQMRPGALLVNVSRGGLIDEEALADALHAGRIGGAALDVFANEPPPPGARILEAPNTVLSPHVAWFSTASGPNVRRATVEAMIVWIESGTVPHGNLAARPLRSRAEAVSGGVS